LVALRIQTNRQIRVGRQIEEKCMKQAWMAVMLFTITLGANAQERAISASATTATANSPEARSWTDESGNSALTTATPAPDAPAAATPADPGDPQYIIWGSRDDYRWQLGVGVDYFRLQSRAFNANLVGLNTSLSYYTNDWFAVEGDFVSGFGSDVYPNSRAKIFGGTGGFRVGGRRARWEPFAHFLAGGGHLQPQTALGSKTGLMLQGGGGVDYRMYARLSLRGEADWVYTTFFSQSQNNLQVVGGIVFHF
jgi:hypothetical protein